MFKSEHIFSRFCRDIYTIKYQKRSFSYMHLLIFLYSANQFLEISYMNKIIYAKLSIAESDYTEELTKIVTLVMLYCPYGDINPHSPTMSNVTDGQPKYTKHYL